MDKHEFQQLDNTQKALELVQEAYHGQIQQSLLDSMDSDTWKEVKLKMQQIDSEAHKAGTGNYFPRLHFHDDGCIMIEGNSPEDYAGGNKVGQAFRSIYNEWAARAAGEHKVGDKK